MSQTKLEASLLFVPYSVNTQFGPRAWSGIGSGEWGLNTSGSTVTSTISARGPMWYSFRVNKSAEYSLSSYITDPFSRRWSNRFSWSTKSRYKHSTKYS